MVVEFLVWSSSCVSVGVGIGVAGTRMVAGTFKDGFQCGADAERRTAESWNRAMKDRAAVLASTTGTARGASSYPPHGHPEHLACDAECYPGTVRR